MGPATVRGVHVALGARGEGGGIGPEGPKVRPPANSSEDTDDSVVEVRHVPLIAPPAYNRNIFKSETFLLQIPADEEEQQEQVPLVDLQRALEADVDTQFGEGAGGATGGALGGPVFPDQVCRLCFSGVSLMCLERRLHVIIFSRCAWN